MRVSNYARPWRHKLASWLIGRDTNRAIYIGPGATTVKWGGTVRGHAFHGAKIALRFADGEFSTVFSTTRAAGAMEKK